MMRSTLFTSILILFLPVLMIAQENTFDIIIKNENSINTDQLEFSPVFFEDGILFISSRDNVFKYIDRKTNSSTMAIYSTVRGPEGNLGAPVFFSDRINTKYHEGPLCFDTEGGDMYFTRSNFIKGKLGRASDGMINLKVLKAKRTENSWGEVSDLPINSDEFNTCHPSLTASGDRLYFASDREGGYGGLDIYYAEFMGDELQDPVNLGPEINSSGDEIFPFIHADGTLYFGSNGRDGLGGLDIYYTKLTSSGNWTYAQNIGAPFNSEKDDFGLILDLETKNGYFSSDRTGGRGADDIYNFHVPQGLNNYLEDKDRVTGANFKVYVADVNSGEEIKGALVSFWDLEDMNLSNILSLTDEEGNLIRIHSEDPESNELILRVDMAEAEINGYTDEDGMYEAIIPGTSHVVAVNAPGYLPRHLVIDREDGLSEMLVLLEPIGDRIPFNGIVLDPRTNTPVAGAKVTITDEETGESVVLYTDKNGQYNYYLPKDRDFDVTIEKDGMKTSRSVSTRNLEDGAEIALAFDISNSASGSLFKEGTVVRIPNIYYNFNDASIRPDAKPGLNAVATILKQFPDLRIELSSHTDARGSTEYNQALSQRRAKKAAEYLKNQGIETNRLTPVGYGESQLKNQCSDGVNCSEADHQVNRRTEFKVQGSSNVEFEYVDNMPANANGNVTATAPQISEPYASEETTKSLPASTSSSESGLFLVIAGTFKKSDNAERRKDELVKHGFADAQIVQTSSGMSAVKVGEFTTQTDASSLVSTLKSNHKIEAYVKRE